jgi:hypothetical protein
MALVVQTTLALGFFSQPLNEKKVMFALLFLLTTLFYQWYMAWIRRLRRYDTEYQKKVARRAEQIARVENKLGIPRGKSTIPTLVALVILLFTRDVLLPIALGYLLWQGVS